MADNSKTTPTCSIHKEKSFKYYCKECKTCICPKCIDEFHEDHTFCKIQSVEEDIRRELGNLLSGSGENECDISSMKQLLGDRLSSLLTHKNDLVKQVEDTEKEIIEKVQETKKEAIAELDEIYNKASSSTKVQQNRLDSFTTELAEKDIAKLDLIDVVGMVSELKQVFESIKDSEKVTPKQMFSKSNSSLLIENLAKIFTEAQEQSCAQVARGECEIHEHEEASDVKREVVPIIVKLNGVNNVRKICPINRNDAWILNETTLRWMKSDTLDTKVTISSVKDFDVSHDGCVFLIQNDSKVYKRVQDGRVVPFVDVDDGSGCFPSCLTVLKDSVVVNVCRNIVCNKISKARFIRTDIYTFEGIRTSFQNTSTNEILFPPKPDQDVLYCNLYSPTKHFLRFYEYGSSLKSSIVLFADKGSNIERVKSFQGVFGADPPKKFTCNGACVDKCGNILVSDYAYKCVYALDKDLKYKSTIVSSSEFDLQYPRAIAVADGLLWLADNEKIFKFKYDSRKIPLM